MSNLETALRRALSKGDISDPAFRRRVYTAAANAMEKSASSNPAMTETAMVERRKQLASVISGLEADLKTTDTIAQTSVSVGEPSAEVPPVKRAPDVSIETSSPAVTAPEPKLRAEPIKAEPPRQSKKAATRAPQKRPFSMLLSVTVAIALVVVGFVWIISTGAFQSADERDTSIPNPPTRLQSEDFAPDTARAPALAAEGTSEEIAASEGWITIFSPSDPTTLGLRSGAEASVQSDPFGDFARLVTPSPDAEVQIDVPIGILQSLQGKAVQISFVARADDGNPTEMAVTCDFNALGDCGRRRFIVGQAPSEYLFRINLPEVGPLDRGGILKLRTDINDNERPVNLLAVRVRAAQ